MQLFPSWRSHQYQGHRLPTLIAQLTDPIAVRKILGHLDHPTEPPRPAPARPREQFDFA
jgi:hypothetical protein